MKILDKIRENEKYQKFKELWNNPKTHSIMVLGLWFVFIAMVIIFARFNVSGGSTSSDVRNDSFNSLKSYDFTYKVNDLTISGQQYNEKQIFYFNNHRYYLSDQNVYIIDADKALNSDFDLGVLKINSIMLNNLLSDINFTEGDGFKQYLVPLDRFINLYDADVDVDLSRFMSYNVVVKVYDTGGIISRVDVDMTNYNYYKEGTDTEYVVNIYFYNLNNVSDFSKDYDKRIGVE